ncbi:MAG TPA: CRTAC1 family protein [Acidimicrobiia bacterium]|nr:CRTAC1 family protein [Acidimicrobiia bacterium]
MWLVAGIVTGCAATIGLALAGVALFAKGIPTEAMGAPHFLEESVAAGVVHSYDGEFTFFVGGGVAVFDCNGDLKPDLYFAGGTNPAALYRNQSSPGGNLQFASIPAAVTDLVDVTGAYPLDVDSDGITDLAVLRFGGNVVLRGTGDCRFERANEAWGIAGGSNWTVAFSATWERSEMLPTLAFGNYVALDQSGTPEGCADNTLFRPGEGPRYGEPLPLSPGWCTLSVLFSDWDRSGRRDLRMTNDRHYYRDGEEQLWRVAEGEPPRAYTEADGWQRMQIWGMGIASHDLTGDGLPEVFLTSQGDNKLQTLAVGNANPTYEDIAFQRGVTAHRPYAGDVALPSTAWHPEFQDVNNDALMDLFITKGNVEAMAGYASRDPSNLLLGNPDGTFTESAEEAGLMGFARGRGAALVDLNSDGMLDLVQVNRRQNVSLWRSLGSGVALSPSPMGNWIAIRLQQAGGNRDAIGSWIEVRIGRHTIEREVTVGGGHAGGQLGSTHFGLGNADRARVRVQWPDGEIGPWITVTANQLLTIEHP